MVSLHTRPFFGLGGRVGATQFVMKLATGFARTVHKARTAGRTESAGCDKSGGLVAGVTAC